MAVGVVVLALLAAGVVAWRLRGDGRPGLPSAEVAAYLDAWGRFDTAAMAALVSNPADSFQADHEAMRDRLRVRTATFAGERPVRVDAERATARFRATLGLAGLGEWAYEGTLTLTHRDGRWLVEWVPSTMHPDFQSGLGFERTRSWATRGSIFGAGDDPLASTGETVSIGVEPRRVKDRAVVVGALAEHLGVPPATATATLGRPNLRPDVFVPFSNVPRSRFETLRPILEPVPGIVFRKETGRVTITEDFARHVLGQTREATAETLEKLGEPYTAGDTVGVGGLEGAHERTLAGAPSGEVRLVDGAGAPVRTLHSFPGTAPQPVVTTLDPAVQGAADQALAGVEKPAAIVAVDGSTGSVLAVASRPLDEAFDRALLGRYPPGSTFKVVTTSALLSGVVEPSSAVTCPATRVVEGKSFKNFEEEELGDITFARAFEESCNTAFAGLAEKLGAARLADAATRFGFNRQYDLGLPSVEGRFPDPADRAETAAAAIGQGRVDASPLHMASVAAAVASGSWRPPVLVVEGRPGGPRPEPAGGESLGPTVAAQLRQLMAAVVRAGTGKPAAEVTGAPAPSGEAGPGAFGGKTGTAEYGSGSPLPTHAWFIGFRGTIGFAVLVEGGGVGGRVAAPIAGRFVAALPAALPGGGGQARAGASTGGA